MNQKKNQESVFVLFISQKNKLNKKKKHLQNFFELIISSQHNTNTVMFLKLENISLNSSFSRINK